MIFLTEIFFNNSTISSSSELCSFCRSSNATTSKSEKLPLPTSIESLSISIFTLLTLKEPQFPPVISPDSKDSILTDFPSLFIFAFKFANLIFLTEIFFNNSTISSSSDLCSFWRSNNATTSKLEKWALPTSILSSAFWIHFIWLKLAIFNIFSSPDKTFNIFSSPDKTRDAISITTFLLGTATCNFSIVIVRLKISTLTVWYPIDDFGATSFNCVWNEARIRIAFSFSDFCTKKYVPPPIKATAPNVATTNANFFIICLPYSVFRTPHKPFILL